MSANSVYITMHLWQSAVTMSSARGPVKAMLGQLTWGLSVLIRPVLKKAAHTLCISSVLGIWQSSCWQVASLSWVWCKSRETFRGKLALSKCYLQVTERLHLHDRSDSTEGKGHFNTLVWAKRGENLEWTSRSETKATKEHREGEKCHKMWKSELSTLLGRWSYLFLLNWMAKSVMTLIALLVRVISIWMTPARRANVPDISSPLAFMAGSQTWTEERSALLLGIPPPLLHHSILRLTPAYQDSLF